MKSRLKAFASAALAASLYSTATGAHPHVWAEARLELAIAGDTVTALQHVWRFDDIFSATVLIEFDDNADNRLDEDELAKVGEVVRTSIADFDYFQEVLANDASVAMAAPTQVIATMQDDRLILIFESKIAKPLPLSGTLQFAVYDPTFYTAIDYIEDADMMAEGLPASCKRQVIRPDPDEIIAQNQMNLTEFFYETTDMSDLSGIFATRLELACGTGNG